MYALNLGVYSIQVYSHRRYVVSYRRETFHNVRLINLHAFTQTSTSPKKKPIMSDNLNGLTQYKVVAQVERVSSFLKGNKVNYNKAL